RDAREEPVAAAVVEVEVRIDDDGDPAHEPVWERLRVPLLAVVLDRRRRVDQPRVDEDEPFGMLDRVGESGQAVTVEEHLARQVPTDVVAGEHERDSFSRRLHRAARGSLVLGLDRSTTRNSSVVKPPTW